jgi:hypothetical protein
MFANECERHHLVNYDKTCCIKHLLMMSELAENQMMNIKYSNLLIKSLSTMLKNNAIDYETMKLDLIKLLLEVSSKFISYFFMENKFNYAKSLVKICMNACNRNALRDHPEIIIRKNAIVNNLACIYHQ